MEISDKATPLEIVERLHEHFGDVWLASLHEEILREAVDRLSITYRESVGVKFREMMPPAIVECVAWMALRYPDVGFSNITWEVAGGTQRSMYFPREKRILICTHGYVRFYARACRAIRGLKERVGRYDPELVVPRMIVHELTHHVQHERGFRKGDEVDTTLNELCWLREHRPAIFKRCFDGPPAPVEVATIRPKRRGASLPAWSSRQRTACRSGSR